MSDIVFLDRATLAPQIKLKDVNNHFTYIEYPQTKPNQLVERLKSTTVVITNKVILDKNILQQLPNLKCICVAATGVNVVDLEFCKRNNITVTNIVDYPTHTVSEHVFMLMLALSKQLKSYNRTTQEGQWQNSDQFCYFTSPISLLKGKTLGLIGTGAIALQTAKIAEVFGMKVNFHSPSGRVKINGQSCLRFNEVLSTSDIISIHTPLNEQTLNLIGDKELRTMKKSCLLINTARGPIIDSSALINALKNNDIAGAGIDVLPIEPPNKDDIVIQNIHLDNLLVTPHVAWASTESMQILADQLIDKVNAFLMGSLLAQDNLST
ncbi:MAG: D-2-hydroxyacid dehydrogenase [Saccharospirillaceae bacterium]|nr:D-2-hydroxyacid dehydrogenase [Saccharospirillaceae bacterium]